MRLFIITLLLIPLFSQSQERAGLPVDSITYYNREMRMLYRQTYDSLTQSDRYKAALEKIKYYESRSDDYGAFVIFGEVAAADYSTFNASIAADGFPPLNGPAYRFGIGVSNKSDRGIVDFNFFAFSFNKKSKKGDEKITSSFSNFLQFDVGYDLVKSQSVNIYPYAGLSFRGCDVEYSKPVQTNGSFTNISNIVLNKQSASAFSLKAGYQAGLGFEFVIHNSTNRLRGTMFFVKAGTNGHIGRENYKVEGIDYKPAIKYGNWIVTTGFKFFSRR